jgi:hypothetical protein
MSEKGQGVGSVNERTSMGTVIGVDGTQPGSGSASTQAGPPTGSDSPPETPEARAEREQAERERHQRAYDESMSNRDRRRAQEEGEAPLPPSSGARETGEGDSALKHMDDPDSVIS